MLEKIAGRLRQFLSPHRILHHRRRRRRKAPLLHNIGKADIIEIFLVASTMIILTKVLLIEIRL